MATSSPGGAEGGRPVPPGVSETSESRSRPTRTYVLRVGTGGPCGRRGGPPMVEDSADRGAVMHQSLPTAPLPPSAAAALERATHLAVLAPSVHNTQPW